MASFHGKSGVVTFDGGGGANIVDFTFDATADVAEATDMGDTWKTYLGGFKDWTASVTCNLDSGGEDPTLATDLGASAALVLDTTTGKSYGGTAICTGVSVAMDKDDIAKVTYTFQGSGALAAT